MNGTRETSKRRQRLQEICAGFPEADSSATGVAGEHLTFRVRKKTFAYYLFDHHGDGRIALCCKAAPGEQEMLVASDPTRFFIPAYLGPKGWIGVRLDLPGVDWEQITHLASMAYRLSAPRTLVARMDRNT